MRLINNWEPETRSLLESLIAAGCTLHSGDNGEYEFTFDGDLAKFIENLIACDEAALYVMTPGKDTLAWIHLVLGNEPGTVASDYICRDEIERATDEHYNKWEGRAQPMKEVA